MARSHEFTRRLLGTTVLLAAVSPLLMDQAVGQTGPATTSSLSSRRAADPGPRTDTTSVGCFLPGLSSVEQEFFFAGGFTFAEVDSSVDEGQPGAIDDAANSPGLPHGTAQGMTTLCPNDPAHTRTKARENDGGLGPRFNADSCGTCHAHPAVGGSSPAHNPQVDLANRDGGNNTVPSFISANGPVREARFINVPGTNTPDGGVHDLFVLTGRTDAPGCNIAQPNFAQAVRQNNVIFRIPTPTFGAGLVENTTDSELLDKSVALSSQQHSLGIVSGFFNHVVADHFNRSGNDGTITRFGWKAQNKSLLIFAGEAYNVEQGISNEAFPNEREDDPHCQFKGTPNDSTELVPDTVGPSPAASFSSDIVQFGGFMRFLAPPTPAAPTASTTRGQSAFNQIGCNLCHVETHTTSTSVFTNQSNIVYHPYSDFALHGMGTGLQDQVSQGAANGQQFRSAPLWGVGQRLFFLHDGRTSDLLTAIEDHASNGSEANQVISNFNSLNNGQQQDILNFLRSL